MNTPDAPNPTPGWLTVVLANVIVLATFVAFYILHTHYIDTFAWSIQEDEWLEWVTVWGFLGALGYGVVASVRQWRLERQWPWFLGGVAFFCFFVAGEEISWAQRIFAYQPPTYFLEENYQQELNLHNVVDTDWRKLAVKVIIMGYGVVLPILMLIPMGQRGLRRLAILGPPLWLVPAFAATYIAYEWYPFESAGEVVEAMMGFGFLFAAMARAAHRGDSLDEIIAVFKGSPLRGTLTTLLVTAVVVLLGVAAAFGSRQLGSGDTSRPEDTRVEIEALSADILELHERRGDIYSFKKGEYRRMGSLHKRVFTFVDTKKYAKAGATVLYEGKFAGLVERGLSEDRARYFLDPWNLPYWVRKSKFRSENGKQYSVLFVYSFGPNRQRDSTDFEIRGDDIGVIIVEEGERPPDLPTRLD